MNSLNAQMQALNETGFKLYDDGNRKHFTGNLRYDSNDDKIVCDFEEEK